MTNRLLPAVCTLLVSSLSWAQPYPSKPIRLVVPTGPGGGYDTVARIVADKLVPELGQPVVVENRVGAGTVVGTNYVAKSAPDGYTIVMGGIASIALAPATERDLPFHPGKDLVAVSMLSGNSYTLVARNEFEASSLPELLKIAKNYPGKYTIGTLGLTSGQGVLAALLKSLSGIDLLEVQYKGAQQVYPDLLSGRLDLFFDSSTATRPLVRGAKVKALAVSTGDRDPTSPLVPTASESGLPTLVFESWLGIFAPAKTPRPVVLQLRKAVGQALQAAELQKRFSELGVRRLSLDDPEQFVNEQLSLWPPLLRKAGIHPDR